MHTISIPQVQQVVKLNVIGLDEPSWFHGEPGCGKSEGINAAIAEVDAELQVENKGRRARLIDFRLGQYDTVDFKGYPEVDRATETTVWRPASTLPVMGNPRFSPDDVKVIFFDEADHGKDSVKGVAYQVVQERRVGEHILQPNTFICLAGNRPQDRGVGGKSPPPLNNRCTHYEAGPNADAWVQWAATQPHIPGELLAFLQFRKNLISTFDPKKPDPAFATPRTWEKVGKYFTSPQIGGFRVDAKGNTHMHPILGAAIEGAVGVGPSAEFIGFCKVINDMPLMKDIEENPMGVEVSAKPEVRWAVAVGIGGELAAKPGKARPFQQYLDRMDPEFGILAWQLGLKKNEALIGVPEFIAMARAHQAIFASVNRS
jgi:hypothetical protein